MVTNSAAWVVDTAKRAVKNGTPHSPPNTASGAQAKPLYAVSNQLVLLVSTVRHAALAGADSLPSAN